MINHIKASISLQYHHAKLASPQSDHRLTNLNEHLTTDFQLNESPFPMEFLHIRASGRICVSHPGRITFYSKDLPYYCLLFTQNASGTLSYSSKQFALHNYFLVLLNYSELDFLDVTQTPFDLNLIFLEGTSLPSYYEQLQLIEYPYLDLNHNIALSKATYDLMKINSTYHTVDMLYIHKQLTNILSDYLLYLLHKQHMIASFPPYILSIKDLFDQNYQHTYTLDELETIFHKNKYRICKEFTYYFHISPIKYLNQVRLETAKSMLEQQDIPIHSVGALVGIENTNHFIKLFKSYFGITPLVYRQQYNEANPFFY